MTSNSSATMSSPTIRVISILSLLTTESPRKLGLVEICSRLGIAKSTCSLVLAEMCASGYLIQEHRTLRYGIGMKPAIFLHPAPSVSEQLPGSADFLEKLHLTMRVPISIVNLSRRSTIVTQTIAPASVLARVGFRRPHLAPFGACFLVDAGEKDKIEWLDHALRMEGRDHELLRLAMANRLDRILEQGFEVVYQWEHEIFDQVEGRFGRWIGDLFEIDARMNSYRREVLRASLGEENSDRHSSSASSVSRIVIPLGRGAGAPPICLEFWLGGRRLAPNEIAVFVERARSRIGDLANSSAF